MGILKRKYQNEGETETKTDVKKVKVESKNSNTKFKRGSFEKVNDSSFKFGKNKKLDEIEVKTVDKVHGMDLVDKKRFTKKSGSFNRFSNTNPKPNWLEFKKKKKELKVNRREQRNPEYELTLQAKKIWEDVRNHNTEKTKRLILIVKLHSMLKGKLSTIIHSHDMARVVQCMLKYGNSEVRVQICNELLPDIVKIMLSKYGCNCVKKLFKHSTNEFRHKLVDGMFGNVKKLLNHSIASKWLEYAYNTWATPKQKTLMRQELYGNMFQLSKGIDAKNLTDIIKNTPEVKPAIMATVKALITKAIEKPNIMVSSLLHNILLDYVHHCENEERCEILESLVERLMQLLTSRDGTIVAMNIVWYGTNKVKKTIVKMLKGHVKEISELEHGHLLLLTVFDSVDDTVLVKKALFKELLETAEEMAVDEIGRRVLLHLTIHRDKSYFHPAEIKLLEEGEKIGSSKKDPVLKHKELLEGVLNPLLDFISANPSHWLSNSSVSMLTLAVFKAAITSGLADVNKLKEAQKALASYIVNEENTTVVEDASMHFVIKKIFKFDSNSISDENIPKETLPKFSSALVKLITESILEKWIKINRACFILVWLLESGETESVNELKSKMSKNIINVLKDETTAGAKILYKNIKKTK